MISLTVQELQLRGIAAVDDLIGKGDVHVLCNDKPRYVVVSADRYKDLLNEENEAYLARLWFALAVADSGEGQRMANSDL